MSLVVAHLIRDELHDGTERRVAIGTVFFLGASLDENAGTVLYAVTARHLIEDARAAIEPHYVRLNLSGVPGDLMAFHDVQIDPQAWTCHPTSDVAVVRWPIMVGFDQDGFIIERLIGHDDAAPLPQVGDPITFLSLFTHSPGRRRNEPVARFGKISRVPGETIPVRIRDGYPLVEVDAYLVEALSWGGNSGAPALYYLPDNVPGLGRNKQDRGPWLLGLVYGHAHERQRVEDLTKQGKDRDKEGNYLVVLMNSGMAIVVPSQVILETLNLPALVEERERLVELARQRGFTKD